jgi:hypothetical protein
VHQIPFICGACNNYLERQKATMMTIASQRRRRRSRLKRIVVSEKNYIALKMLRHAGDSFNDVITKLLRIEKDHQKKQRQELQQQQSEHDNSSSSSNSELSFPGSLSELFDERQRQQLADLALLEEEEEKEQLNNQERRQ